MKVEIDGKEVDVYEGNNVNVVNQWFSFEKYFFLKSPVSTSIKLPLTNRNKSALKGVTSGGDGSEKTLKPVRIYFWQSFKIFDGTCYIENVSDGYEVFCYGGGRSLKELLGDEKLWQLTGSTIYFDPATVDNLSDNDNLDVKFNLLDNGRYPINFDNNFKLIDFFVSFKTKYVIDQIFTDKGYTVDYNFDTTEFLKDYTASSYPMKHNKISTDVITGYRLKAGQTEVSTGWPTLTGSSDKYWIMPDPNPGSDYEEYPAIGPKVKDFISFEFEKVYSTVDAPNVWISRGDISIKISVYVNGTYSGGGTPKALGVYVAVKPQDNEDGTENEPVIKYLLPLTVVGSAFSVAESGLPIDLEKGDRLYCYFVQYVIASPGTFTITGINFIIVPGKDGESFSVDELEDFEDLKALPNITKIDYLKDIFSNFDLFIDIDNDNKKAGIYSLNDAKTWSQTSKNISKYIDVNTIEINTMPNLAQKQNFGYKDDKLNLLNISDNRLDKKGDAIEISDIPDLTDTRSRLFKSVNMIDVTEGGNIKDTWEYVRYTKGVTEENESIDIDLDLGSTSTLGAKQFSCAKFQDGLSVTYIMDNWHTVKQAIFKDYFKLSALFDFPKSFQNTLKGWQCYYINCTNKDKFISGHFLLQKVQFSEKGRTKLELIKLPEIETGTPPPETPWQWNSEDNIQWNSGNDVDQNNNI